MRFYHRVVRAERHADGRSTIFFGRACATLAEAVQDGGASVAIAVVDGMVFCGDIYVSSVADVGGGQAEGREIIRQEPRLPAL